MVQDTLDKVSPSMTRHESYEAAIADFKQRSTNSNTFSDSCEQEQDGDSSIMNARQEEFMQVESSALSL